MKVQPSTIAIATCALIAAAATSAISRNPQAFTEACTTIFKNTVVKGSALGLGAGLAVSGLWFIKQRISPQQSSGGNVTALGASIARLLAWTIIPPIVGLAAGALISGGLSLSRHVTIQVK